MSSHSITSQFFPEVQAGGFTRIDGTIAFYQRVNALVDKNSVVIDFGAGRGAGQFDPVSDYRRSLRTLKGKVSKVIGLDVDRAVMTNPSLDEAHVLDERGCVQLTDGVADLIVSDFTFEHIADPEGSAREIERLLKPGGWICARTPNKFGYIALGNRLVPEKVKHGVLSTAQPDRLEEDVFPAVYLLNTRADLLKHFPPARFEHFVYGWDAEPGYHANRRSIYRAFLLLHQFTPPSLKTMLMIFIRKRQNQPYAEGIK
ncbi:methyltransferase domain-containing protein [Bradyrhizobium sp. WYCCWR 12699]|uniref:class I SAM-dependent methyltransferase n=1 Tax=Bradyrhizobium sp. WYCCWR 12699 TaxID=3064203 RepID=UPI0028A3874F|nr:methyltransferase domain-containing protein [Bradyrhizobium sp. WYCCWR 12699]MDT4743662.1 methyltransferase domain-containing protein [Bradyrhizobium sp. WYCCWR 12699]